MMMMMMSVCDMTIWVDLGHDDCLGNLLLEAL